jgi:hypothetical protein
MSDVLAVDDDRARVGTVEAGDQAERGRFPASRRPEQGKELAGIELDLDPVQRHHRAERPTELPELKVRHQRVAAPAGRGRPRPTNRSASIAAQTMRKLSSESAAASYGCVSFTS